jgi:hypothetical protein
MMPAMIMKQHRRAFTVCGAGAGALLALVYLAAGGGAAARHRSHDSDAAPGDFAYYCRRRAPPSAMVRAASASLFMDCGRRTSKAGPSTAPCTAPCRMMWCRALRI